MDWQVLQNGLRDWVALALGIPAGDIAWDGEPELHRGFPRVDLQLERQGADRATDEVRYELNELGRLVPVIYAHRTLALRITVQSRDQRGSAKAYALLERLRMRLELPVSTDALDALGVVVRDVSVTADAGAVSDMREESAATLQIILGYADVLRDEVNLGDRIEQVELGGTVESGSETITVPEQTLP